ncbi:proenkephalin b [Trichomycterus rosablanca]|uniref:proenkephalin b n=1 Tax=Trichomycterus rosablanca TaxID=2290929 RepID=UPI002F355E3F
MKLWLVVGFHWALFVSACLARMVSANCGTDCAYCSLHLRLQQIHLNSIECVIQCEGNFNTDGSWGLCQNLLQTTESTPEAEQVSTETTSTPGQHQDEKRYGGFMKRYGGFMKRYGGFMKRYGGFMKKAAELSGPEPEDFDRGRAILSTSDMKMLADQVEKDGEREEAAMKDNLKIKKGVDDLESLVKRYGGFMRRGYDTVGEAGLLQKRYGGFMRRVGRPDWREEPRFYRSFPKRSAQEENDAEKSSEMAKRYGGFMEY